MVAPSQRDPDSDARWAARLARGVAHDFQVRRRLTLAVTAQLELAEEKIARCADAAGFGILEPSHELVRADDRP
jgi:hypothetical protein